MEKIEGPYEVGSLVVGRLLLYEERTADGDYLAQVELWGPAAVQPVLKSSSSCQSVLYAILAAASLGAVVGILMAYLTS